MDVVFKWIVAGVILGVIYAAVYRTSSLNQDRKLYLGGLFLLALLLVMNVTYAVDEAAYWGVTGWFTFSPMSWVWLALILPGVALLAASLYRPAWMTRFRLVAAMLAFLVGYVVMMLDFVFQIANAR